MIANLLVLLLFVGLIVLFGWLCYRSIRSGKMWVKIVGDRFCPADAGIRWDCIHGRERCGCGVLPGAPDVPDLTVATTPEQIARGQYLVNLSCIGCLARSGRTVRLDATSVERRHQYVGIRRLRVHRRHGCENLTPGGKLAGYSDGEIFRAIRNAVNQDGRNLGFMSFLPLRPTGDADTEAIIAIFVPAAGRVKRPDRRQVQLHRRSRDGSGHVRSCAGPRNGVITGPPEGATAEYGKYVATYGDCRGCHGPDMTGAPASAVGPAVPNPRPLVSTMDQAQFMEMLRTGVRPGKPALPRHHAVAKCRQYDRHRFGCAVRISDRGA